MMNPLEALAQQAEWAAKNTAYNLEFIPADRLSWKPAPTASSALEIVNHMVTAVRGALPMLAGGEWTMPEFTPATNLAEAQQLLTGSAGEYAAALRRVVLADLGRTVEMRRGPFPLAQAAGMPVVDLIHHHGQIAYLQTLLGDTESHFAP
jgi:uncharacterized damage-inducible protein DinB